MRRRLLLFLTICIVVLSAVCTVSMAAVNVTGIDVSGTTEIARGYSSQFKAVITPSNASNQNVKWSVSVDGKKTTYAAVDASGKVTVKSDAPLGTVIVVKATAQDGSKVSGTRKFTVKTPVKSVTIQNGTGMVITGKTLKEDLNKRSTYHLSAISEPAKATSHYLWKSSDKEVATINSKGEVSFLKNGKVTITATARDGTKKNASVTFNVVTSVTGIELSGLGTVEAGESRTIKAKIIPSSASNKNVEWSVLLNGKSSKLVSIANGKVTVSKNAPVGGTIKVTASAVDGSKVSASGEMKITGPILVRSITIEGAGAVEAGGSRQLKAVIEPADATNKKVKWSAVLDGKKSDLVSISNGNVTVDQKVSGGSVITVTAAASDGSGVSATAKMRVNGPVFVKSIKIEGAGTIKAGGSRTLTAVVEPSNADNKQVKWSVVLDGHKSDLVTVSNGKVTVKKGVPNGSVVTVTAKASDGSGVVARVKMSVNAPIMVSSIRLEGAGPISAGGTRTLTAVVEPSNAANKTVEWSVLLDGKNSLHIRVDNGRIYVDNTVPGGSTLTVIATAADGSGASAKQTMRVVSSRPIESIKLTGAGEVARGGTIQIRSAITPSDAEVQKLTWSVKEGNQDTPYASVSGDGTLNVNPNAPVGIVLTVKAVASDGSKVSASKKIRVTEPVQSLFILDPAGYDISWQNLAVRLNNIREMQLGIAVAPANASNKVTWASSDRNVADVSNGKVTFYRSGAVTITAYSTDGSGKSVSVYLTGRSYITGIELSGTDSIVPGGTQMLQAKIYPEDAENQQLNWYALLYGRSTGLASVSNGEVHLDYRVPVGSVVTIVAEAADGSGVRATKELNVIQWVPVSDISISGPGAVAQGMSVKLKASIKPSDATNKTVKWSIPSREWTHPNITLDSNGKITIGNDVPSGTVFTVRAEPTDESVIYAEKIIRVVPPTQYLSILDSSQMNMTGGSYAIRLNDSREIRLIAGTWPVGTSGEFTWTSSDPNIADVDANGTVTFKNDGMVTITVTATDGTGAAASVYLTGVTLVSEIRINDSDDIDPGETRMISVDVLPANAANKNLTWYVLIDGQQTSLAGVSNGQVWVSPNAPLGSLLTVVAMSTDGSGIQAQQTMRIGRPVPVQKINLVGAETAYPGTSVDIHADVSPYNATNQTLNWTVLDNGSQPSYARISENGTVTIDSYAPSGAVLTVMASAADGSNAVGITYIRVISPLQFVMIQDAAGTNLSGQMLNINMSDYNMMSLWAVPYPADVMTGFVWQSSDPSIASVDAAGNITFYRDGMVTISATASNGSNKSASVTLTIISQQPLSGIHIESSGVQAEDGTLICSLSRTNVIRLTAVPEPADASGNFIWASSNPEIASVDQTGKVVFRAVGQVIISVYDTVSGIRAEVPVRSQHSISSIEIIGPDPNCIMAGKSYALSAKIFPENAERQDLIWSVVLDGEKSSRISISKTGVLKCGIFLKKGTVATVTAAASDGSGVIGQLDIPVVGKPKKISLTDAQGINTGFTITINLNETPELYLQPHAQPDDTLELFEMSLTGYGNNILPVEYRVENCKDCTIPKTEYLYIKPNSAGYYTFKIYSSISPETSAYLTINAVE